MELSQGNSLCRYLKQMSFFFCYKIKEQEGGPRSYLGEGWYQWAGGRGGESVQKGEYSANTVYTCM
jgi:hypothetical protein